MPKFSLYVTAEERVAVMRYAVENHCSESYAIRLLIRRNLMPKVDVQRQTATRIEKLAGSSD